MRYAVVALLFAALDVLLTAPAHARAQTEVQYPLAEAFSTALRFVRVDRGCKVVDKDADAAFVSFECSDDGGGGKIKRGSLELFKVAGGVRTQVTLGDDTHGMELRWLELYERKLKEELGEPIPVAPPKPAPAPSGKDGGV